MFTDDCATKRLKDRYIPIEAVPNLCGITVEMCEQLIKDNKIRYAEFKKPNEHFRSIHVDPVEIGEYLNHKKGGKV